MIFLHPQGLELFIYFLQISEGKHRLVAVRKLLLVSDTDIHFLNPKGEVVHEKSV